MEMTDEALRINVKKILDSLRHHIKLMILLSIIGAAIGYGMAEYVVTPQYQTSVVLYVNNTTESTDGSTTITSQDLSAAQSLVDTYAIFVKSKTTLNKVIEETGLSYSYGELNSMVSAHSINSTEVFRVTVTGSSPKDITTIANAIADIAPETISSVITGSSAYVIDYADVPSVRSYPDRNNFMLRGLGLGFLFSLIIILIISIIENQTTVEEVLKERFQAPVLSVIPDIKDENDKKKILNRRRAKFAGEDFTIGDQLKFAPLEAYKLLRTNLSCCLPDLSGCKVIGVTSSNKGEGKTTTSINIAHVLSQKGLRVCLLELDLRMPTLSGRLQLSKKAGITDYLTGEVQPTEIMQKVNTQGMSFYTIPAGTIPPNPSELIGSKKMELLFTAIKRTSFDYIIVDLPPVMAVSDPLAAGSLVDGMILAVREDFYENKVILDTTNQLTHAGINLLGYVVTHSTTREKEFNRYKKYNKGKYGYEGYGYGYYAYGYGYETQENTSSKNSDNKKDAK